MALHSKGQTMALIGTDTDDELKGTAGVRDTFVGLKGSDKLRGNDGDLPGSSGDHDIVDYSLDAQSGGTLGIRINLWGGGARGNIAADSGFDGFGSADSIKGIQDVIGTKYKDVIYGGSHSNYLTGGSGNDLLDGFKGKDNLTGGAGADKLYGGADADVFIYASIKDSTAAKAGRDTIFDFSHAQRDKIDLKAIDANTKAASNQAFKFIGNQSFHNKAGELRWEKVAGGATVHGDVNGDGRSDFSIFLSGTGKIVSGDFIL
jgi:serralysin